MITEQAQIQVQDIWSIVKILLTVIGSVSWFFLISMWKTTNRIDKRQAVTEPQIKEMKEDIAEIKKTNIEFRLLKHTVERCKNCNS